MLTSEKYNHNNDIETPNTSGTANEKGTRPEIGNRARLARLTPKWARITDPMIPMNMFRSYDVVATSWATFASGMVMLGVFYFIAIFYVIVQGKDSVSSGVQLLYFAPGIVSSLFGFSIFSAVLTGFTGCWCYHFYSYDQSTSSAETSHYPGQYCSAHRMGLPLASTVHGQRASNHRIHDHDWSRCRTRFWASLYVFSSPLPIFVLTTYPQPIKHVLVNLKTAPQLL